MAESVSAGAVARRTRSALGIALGRRDGLALTVGVGVGYLLVYLFAIGHLVPGVGSVDLVVVAEPLERALTRESYLLFEPVALVDLGAVRFLFSPVNVLLGLVLGVLVGINAALAWLAYRHPSCGIERSAGAFAGIPALLSGAACCGPTVLIVLGIQATGALIAAVAWLVPASAALLVVGTVLAAQSVAP